jgi:hypothetical protein
MSCDATSMRSTDVPIKEANKRANEELHIPSSHRAPAPNPYEKVHDPVNSPSHYNKGNIEVADFIADQQLNFDRGNAVKYICRAGDKGDAELSPKDKAIQDLKKAVWYLQHEIKWIETYGLPG